MVFARLADYFATADERLSLADNATRGSSSPMESVGELPQIGPSVEDEVDEEAARPPYIHVGAFPKLLPSEDV